MNRRSVATAIIADGIVLFTGGPELPRFDDRGERMAALPPPRGVPQSPYEAGIEPRQARPTDVGRKPNDVPASTVAVPLLESPRGSALSPPYALKTSTARSNGSPVDPTAQIKSPADVVVDDLRTEMVTRGDNLRRIGRSQLGYRTRYTQIYVADASQIRAPELIYPGQVFDLPHRGSKTRFAQIPIWRTGLTSSGAASRFRRLSIGRMSFASERHALDDRDLNAIGFND